MRARRRRSVTNAVSAAILEVAIMATFIIIAQPQLRDGLMQLLHAHTPVSEVQTTVREVRHAVPQYYGSFKPITADNPVGPIEYAGGQSAIGEPTNWQSSPAVTATARQWSPIPAPAQPTQPTQLLPGQWNVASAAQSPGPMLNALGYPSTYTGYSIVAPPPYGTQNQWK